MPETALRAYLTEIDDLIEHEHLDEAIAHSRHILQTYPKHLDTYRLLGKAYLEAKRYGDAADIFQRVLSAIPDDFVAHVGMAIVREDEGNTEAAIWHMERAFETNPANPAIQQELRRLIGRRDGIEPHKIRLTRGALARMYAHGELYPQAVAELRAALQEDPDRADLQVILADMYWRTGQRAEAVDLCNRILERLPFCREANRILAAGLQATGRNDEAVAYHRRLAMLDPYAGFISAGAADPQTVAAESVRIEKLSWAPGQALPAGQPEWASSLGVDLRATEPAPQEPPPAPVPSWLESLEAQKGAPPGIPASEEPATAPFAEAPEEAKSEIPSWMRQAGWQEPSGEAVETHLSFSEEEIASLDRGGLPAEAAAPPPEGELAPGQIPDWLRAAAPRAAIPATPAEEATPAETAGAALPEWIDEITPPPPAPEGEEAAAYEASPWPPREPAAEPEAPALEAEPLAAAGWAEPTAPAEAGLEGAGTGELPTWLEEPSPGATDTIITWLGDKGGREPEAEETAPPWLGETAAAGAEPDLAEAIESEPAAYKGPPPEDTLSGDFTADRTPGWLSAVADAAAQQEPLRPDEVARLRERGETVQASAEGEEWLEGGEGPEAGEPAAAPEAPDWLKGLKSLEPTEGSEAAPGEEVPEWLREPSEIEAAGAPPGQEPPDWLSGVAGAEPVEEPEPRAPRETFGELAGVTPPAAPTPAPAEEAPDWLRGLAEAELGEAAGPAAEAEGDWLRAMAESEEAGVVAQGPQPGEKPVAPDWLRDLGEAAALAPSEPEPSLEAPVTEGARAPEFEGEIEWLPETPEETAAGATEEVPTAEAEAAASVGLAGGRLDEDDVLQWLESLAAEQEGAPAATMGEEAGPGLPLAVEEAAPVLEERELPEAPVEGLEWLERLAEERGVEAGVEAGPPEARELAGETPEWLLETTPMESRPQVPGPSPEAGEELPEWLRFAEETKPAELAAAAEEALEAAPWPYGKEAETPYEGMAEVPAEPEAVAPTAAPEPIEETGFETAQWLREFEFGETGIVHMPPEEAAAPAVGAPPIPEEMPAAAGPEGPAAGEEVVLLLPGDEALKALEAELEQSIPEWLRRSGEPMAELEAEEPAGPRPEIQAAPEAMVMPAEPPAAVVPPTPEPAAPPAPALEAVPPAPPLEVPAPPPAAPPPPIFEAAPPAPIFEEAPAAPPAEVPAPAPELVAAPKPIFEVAAPAPVVEAPPAVPPAEVPVPAPEAAAAPTPIFEGAPPAPRVPAEPVVAPPPTPVEVPPFEVEAPPRAGFLPSEMVLPAPPVVVPPVPAAEAAPAVPPVPTVPVVTPPRPPEARAPEPTFVAPPTAAVEPAVPAERPPIVTPPPEAMPMPEAAPVVTPRVVPPKPAPPSPAELLEAARRAMTAGDIQTSLGRYAMLIRRKRELNTVIEDLRSALGRGSALPEVWQALGDAYMKADRLPEAIEAYRRGLESV